MKLILKISITASTLFLLLTQIFSFYLIRQNHIEKIDLLKETEKSQFQSSIRKFDVKLGSEILNSSQSDTMLENRAVYYFRSTLLDNSALFMNDDCVFNNSEYEYEASNSEGNLENNQMINTYEKKVNGKNILVFKYMGIYKNNSFTIFHVLDITDIYEKSIKLVIKEFVISLAMSAGIIFVLNILIQRITKPLKITNETQRQLIGSLSHELKTPLTAMKGYSETILTVNISKEQQEKALSYIYTECGRLSRLIEKMIELTKLYESDCSIKKEELLIYDLFQAVFETVAHALDEKEIILQINVTPKDMTLQLDRDLMTSFLINLINNSILASPKGGNIWMEADEISIRVRDQGCGIPKKEVDKVKKAFYRVDKSRSRKSGNMGLGLALCEQIAAIHGSTLKIESKVNEGTQISFVYGTLTKKGILKNKPLIK